jgi:deoxyribodipyrimidine photo-lyase
VANADALRRDFENREQLTAYLQEQFRELATLDGPFELAPTWGGEQAARTSLLAFRATRYAASRNFLSGSVSRLSPYIRHGVLTLREVSQHVVKQAGGFQTVYKFVQELAWRDYWQRLYFDWGNGIWLDREEWKTGFAAAAYADDMPLDITQRATKLACIDAFSETLVTEGYLHNHARMWFAAYLVHWRRVKWQAGARWFLSHLLDGDPASNNLSWQWVASTFSNKPYIFNRENLERYTEGAYCANCPSRQACPFDKTYDTISAELFPEGTA